MGAVAVRVTVAVWVALVAGCGTAHTEPSPELQDRVFFSELSDDPSFLTADRDDLVRLAHQVCDRFGDDGKRVTIERLVDGGISLKRALKLATAAATAYCPEHLAELR